MLCVVPQWRGWDRRHLSRPVKVRHGALVRQCVRWVMNDGFWISCPYTGPIFWYGDHAVIEVRIVTKDLEGRPHTVKRFYIDRAMYGGEDHIFFEWPSTLIYPGSVGDKVVDWLREHGYPEGGPF